MIDDYKKYFNEMIWARGNAYVKAGNVKSLRQVNNKWVAIVDGGSSYVVRFSTNPVSMSCTCPNANDGYRCKHMAAAFITYENAYISQSMKAASEKNASAASPYEACEWYQYAKKNINSRGILSGNRAFAKDIEQYFDNIDYEYSGKLNKRGNDVILLVKFLNNNADLLYFKMMDLFVLCMIELYKIRKVGTSKQVERIDKEVLLFLKKAKSQELVISILQNYYIEDTDLPIIENFLKINNNAAKFLATVIGSFEKNAIDVLKAEKMSLEFVDNSHAREWLIAYYRESKQFDKGIQLLEAYIHNVSKINQDTHVEQLELFNFYVLDNNIKKRDNLFEELLKNRKINKSKLFKTLKEGMSEVEWLDKGISIVKGWVHGKNDDTSYEIFSAINGADLMFEKMIMDGFNIDSLRKYNSLLSDYDEGAVYSMYKAILKNEIEYHPMSSEWVVNEFCYRFPKTENAMKALKIIIVELQDDFSDNEKIIKALESVEDTLYEETIC